LSSYEIGHQGHVYLPNDTVSAGTAPLVKAAFAQFLKVRHGGSGFLFAYGAGATGTRNPTYTTPPADNEHLQVASDRQLRCLYFPATPFQVMRPAPPRPSPYSLPVLSAAPYTSDPGLRNPNLYQGYQTAVPPSGLSNATPPAIVPPAIPARRLFQNPDAYVG